MRRLAAALTTAALLTTPAVSLASSTKGNYTAPGLPKIHNHGKTTPATVTRTPGASTTPSGQVQAATATRSVASSSLPFTGIDVLVLASGGAVLLAAGLVVRRLSVER